MDLLKEIIQRIASVIHVVSVLWLWGFIAGSVIGSAVEKHPGYLLIAFVGVVGYLILQATRYILTGKIFNDGGE